MHVQLGADQIDHGRLQAVPVDQFPDRPPHGALANALLSGRDVAQQELLARELVLSGGEPLLDQRDCAAELGAGGGIGLTTA